MIPDAEREAEVLAYVRDSGWATLPAIAAWLGDDAADVQRAVDALVERGDLCVDEDRIAPARRAAPQRAAGGRRGRKAPRGPSWEDDLRTALEAADGWLTRSELVAAARPGATVSNASVTTAMRALHVAGRVERRERGGRSEYRLTTAAPEGRARPAWAPRAGTQAALVLGLFEPTEWLETSIVVEDAHHLGIQAHAVLVILSQLCKAGLVEHTTLPGRSLAGGRRGAYRRVVEAPKPGRATPRQERAAAALASALRKSPMVLTDLAAMHVLLVAERHALTGEQAKRLRTHAKALDLPTWSET